MWTLNLLENRVKTIEVRMPSGGDTQDKIIVKYGRRVYNAEILKRAFKDYLFKTLLSLRVPRNGERGYAGVLHWGYVRKNFDGKNKFLLLSSKICRVGFGSNPERI